LSECKKLKHKHDKSVANVQTNSCHATSRPSIVQTKQLDNDEKVIHPLFSPYCKQASLVRTDGSVKSIQTLRDTGEMQSLLKDTHNSSDYITTGKTRLLKGITTDTVTVPLLQVHLKTDFTDEIVLCVLVNELPDGIDFLISNDIWLQTHPLKDKVITQAVVTRSAARNAAKQDNNFHVTDQFHQTSNTDHDNDVTEVVDQGNESDQDNIDVPIEYTPLISDTTLSSFSDRNQFFALQKADLNLSKIRQKCASNAQNNSNSYFFLQDELLMHHFTDKATSLHSR